MSLFSWFSRKPAAPKAPLRSAAGEPSGLLNADATVPLAPGGRPLPPQLPQDHAANRKNERMERRELLYTVVREAMVRAGVLSASYKFKVLSLDQRGRQFLVMMDLAREYGGETTRLSEIEALIAQTAKSRYDILVTAVYWRINDHVAVGAPLKGVAPQGAALRPPVPARPVAPVAAPVVATPAQAARPAAGSPVAGAAAPATPSAAPDAGILVSAPALAPVAAPAAPLLKPAGAPAQVPVRPAGSRFDPIEADEVAAFKRALADAASQRATPAPAAATRPGVPVRSGPLLTPAQTAQLTGFEDTEMPSDGPSQDLSSTQYGDLH